MIDLNLTTATRIGLNCLGLLGVAIALWLGDSIFVPLTIAVLLAAILWPVVSWLNRRLRIPWGMACAMAVGLLLSGFAIVTLAFALAIPNMLLGLPSPNNEAEQQRFYSNLRDQVMKVSPVSVDSVLPENAKDSKLFEFVKDLFRPENIQKALWPLFKYQLSWLLQLVLIMFILLFLLLEGRMLTLRVVEIFGPSPEVQSKVVEALSEMAKSIRTYLVWRTIVNFGLGLILALVFQAAGLHQAWTWGMLAAVLCYVPYIGTIIASIPPVIDAFVNVDPRAALGILLFYAVVVTVEGYLIVPVVMGRSMDLNATTVILSCLFWDLVWGTPGLFLAMPLMAGIKAVCMYVPGWRPIANLMGTDETPAPTDSPPKLATVAPPLADDKTVVMNDGPLAAAKSESTTVAR